MPKMSLSPPSGTRDFTPHIYEKRQKIFDQIKIIFKKHGFMGMDTPSFERIETLTGKYGDEGEKLIFKILKRGEKQTSGEVDYALRYDLTVPAMRSYTHHVNEFPKIFKRYQIGPVWRADRPGKGRYREFYQCDIDIMGSNSLLSETEIIITLEDVLKNLGLKNFTFKVNSRNILLGLLEFYNIPYILHKKVLIALDKFDKIGLQGVIDELKLLEIDDDILLSFVNDLQSQDFEKKLRHKIASTENGQRGLKEVDQVIEKTRLLSSELSIEFDPLLARGLDYYTGIIFEIVSNDFKGSLGAGGRYDSLSTVFSKNEVPVCGGSLGIERILLLIENDSDKNFQYGADIYISLWDNDLSDGVVDLITILKENNFSYEYDLTGKKLKHQFKSASERGCRFIMIYGPEEREQKKVMLKNLSTGQQDQIDLDNLARELDKRLVR